MERKTVQGKEFVFDKVQIQGKEITFVGAISPVDSNMVEIKCVRPKEAMKHPDMVVHYPIQDYIAELKFMANYLNINGMTNENFANALLKLCQNHISKYGRMVDADLESYIDLAIILQNAIWVSSGAQFTYENAQNCWAAFSVIAVGKVKNDLYITQYDSNYRPYLVKATDLM